MVSAQLIKTKPKQLFCKMSIISSIIYFILLQSVLSYKLYTFDELCIQNDVIVGDNEIESSLNFTELNESTLLPSPLPTAVELHQLIQLDEGNNSAAFIYQTWNETSFSDYSDCTFRISVRRIDGKDEPRGLFFYIKNLNLRKTNDHHCIDYIRFEYDNNTISKKICGEIRTTHRHINIENFFQEYNGAIKVHVSINTSHPMEDVFDTLQVGLVFTEYVLCANCGKSLLHCSPQYCISDAFKNDGIINCPPPHVKDEDNAHYFTHVSSISSRIITFLLAFLGSLILVITFVTVCWYFGILLNLWYA